MCEEYNGWSNRETWATALWLDNDQNSQEAVQSLAEAAHAEHGEDKALERHYLGEAIRELVEDMTSLENLTRETYLMLTDIGSLYRVDWREVAESYQLQQVSA